VEMINSRKTDHLEICAQKDVESGNPGFDCIELDARSNPGADFKAVDTSTKFLGKKFRFPLMFEAVSGGTRKAGEFNKSLASIAQEYGLGFGVGSQRAMIEDKSVADTFKVRDVAPDIFLVANIGAVQLNYGYGVEQCREAVESIEADALALHFNPLQEVFQPEGDTNFYDLTKKVNEVCRKLKVPVIAKGVGNGLNLADVEKLDVDAIDVGGVGGTSWAIIESGRSGNGCRLFDDFGVPTVECLLELGELGKPLIASGGVRSGVDAAKSIALGASLAGVALPLVKNYFSGGAKAVEKWLSQFMFEFKTSMFLTGSFKVEDLRGKVLL